jgi:hypothetical protein
MRIDLGYLQPLGRQRYLVEAQPYLFFFSIF